MLQVESKFYPVLKEAGYTEEELERLKNGYLHLIDVYTQIADMFKLALELNILNNQDPDEIKKYIDDINQSVIKFSRDLYDPGIIINAFSFDKIEKHPDRDKIFAKLREIHESYDGPLTF